MKKTLIIAEAGVNHNGSLRLAKEMVNIAKECGADIVKFQTADLNSVVSKNAEMTVYQKQNTGMNVSQKDMLKSLLLPFEDFRILASYCKEIDIGFMSTPFDLKSINFLNDIQNVWKIPSGEITNYPYLVKIAETRKRVILSTGMSTLNEIEEAINVLRENGTTEIALLHCTTEYPAPIQDVNLRAMISLKEYFGCEVGYSDHTKGIEVPIAAVAMGAKIIEKHFTIDHNMEGPDHKASLEPKELAEMISAIRNIEMAMGDGSKGPSSSEKKNISIVRKSIIAARDIRAGEIFTEKNLTTKRPGNGINPMKWEQVLGTVAIRDFIQDELIEI